MRGAAIAAILSASCAWSQSARDSYRNPYQAWRQTAPALEESASAPTAAFADQVRASSEAAQVFFNARAASLLTPFPEVADQLAWSSRPLATAETLLTVPQEVQQLLAVAAAKVGNDINSLTAPAEKDAAIRRFRQSIERERAALRALMDTLAAARMPLTALIDASDEAEIQRALTGQALSSAAGRRTQLSEHLKREAADWATYYKDLQEGATANRTLTSALTSNATPAAGASPTPGAAKITRPNPNGPPALARYTGEWEFPTKGLYYGRRPDSADLVVQETNGMLGGTLTAKYSGPAAELKIQFQGPVQEGRTQTFPVQFPNGENGSVELIPGTAINLLEINFVAPSTTGPINAANLVLVKR